jgi:hypothetical protein
MIYDEGVAGDQRQNRVIITARPIEQSQDPVSEQCVRAETNNYDHLP